MLNGANILITGGTGSFGKMYIKNILNKYRNLNRIVVYSRDELKQFEMQHTPPFNDARIRYFIGDVRDKERMLRAFENVDIVIHAAALKQVPSCEYNPFEAIKTNVNGAQNVIEAAIDRSVKKVVALSTDKACAPINLYGATKLCSDKLFIAGNAYVGPRETRFSVVRYGNVAGSRGSVIPFFKKLIDSGAKEIPITDERMTRFLLKIEEAVEMVSTALEAMQGGELFVRKIPSMKVTDLAKAMAPDLPIKIIGVKPGEKMHELMISTDDARNTIELDKYYIIQPDFSWWNPISFHKEGKRVPRDFEYQSGNNSQWLSVKQLQKLVREI